MLRRDQGLQFKDWTHPGVRSSASPEASALGTAQQACTRVRQPGVDSERQNRPKNHPNGLHTRGCPKGRMDFLRELDFWGSKNPFFCRFTPPWRGGAGQEMRASCSAHQETPRLKVSGRSKGILPRSCDARRSDGRRNGGDLVVNVGNAGRSTASAPGLNRAGEREGLLLTTRAIKMSVRFGHRCMISVDRVKRARKPPSSDQLC